MKVLNISSNDLIGSRFNGFDVRPSLAKRGIEASLGCFWNHDSSEPWAFNLFPGAKRRLIAEGIRVMEVITGHQNSFQWWSNSILEMAEFAEADLIHLQIVHDHFLRFEVIRRIAMQKPTVWTWHDLWPITGHCNLPLNCSRWSEGCGSCPDLSAPLPVLRDRTKKEYRRKLKLIESSQLHIHVSTKWMEERVRGHLKTDTSTIHRFPFGIDLEVFRPMIGSHFRNQIGIDPSSFVVFARATDDPRKSFKELVHALDQLADQHDVVLLTVQDQTIAERQSRNLRIVQFPWVSNNQDMAKLYAVCDVFAMPSTIESFGVMALEAMASGKPVVHIADTATAEVVDDEEFKVSGIDIRFELLQMFQILMSDPIKVRLGGERARKRAEVEFSLNNYLNNLVSLYTQVLSR